MKKRAKKKAPKKRARKAAKKSVRRGAAKRAAKPRTPRKPRKPRKPVKPKAAKKPKKRKKPKSRKAPKKHTVILSPPSGPDHVPHLSKSRKDKVRWRNEDSEDHELIFTIWPFLQPQVTILVPAGGESEYFTIDSGAGTRTYSYAISPPFANQGPPDPPEVVADP